MRIQPQTICLFYKFIRLWLNFLIMPCYGLTICLYLAGMAEQVVSYTKHKLSGPRTTSCINSTHTLKHCLKAYRSKMNAFRNYSLSFNDDLDLQEFTSFKKKIPCDDVLLRFHEAAASGDLPTVQDICINCSECLNKTNGVQDDSALHIAARSNQLHIFSFLLSKDKLDIQRNRRGHNALDVAIETKNIEIALHISNHSRWREFLHEKEQQTDLTQLQCMVINMPNVAESFLDRYAEQNGNPETKAEFSIKYDFALLYGMPSRVETNAIRKPSETLKTMVEMESIACLTNPVCMAFLKDKWQRIGFWLFYVGLVFYIVFLVCLTTLSILLQYRSPDIVTYIWSLRSMVILMCSMHLAKEVIQLIQLKFHYFKEFENWIELCLYVMSLTSMIIYGNNQDKKRTTIELRGTMALSMFLSWTVLILHIKRSMTFGTYIIMMVTIVTTLVKIVVLMLPFVCAYGIPFFIIFSIPEFPPCEEQRNLTTESCSKTTETSKYLFESMFLSLWTTFMLLLGEMKYPHTLYKYQPLPYPIVTYLVYLTFVLCMPIIIKNLMIGLSVGDVKRIKESARQKHFLSQVNAIINMDKNLPSFVLRWLYVPHVTEYPLRKVSLSRKILNVGFFDTNTQKLSQKGKRIWKMERKVDADDMGNKIANLSLTINNQEKKINEIFDILQDIRTTMTSWKDNTSKL